MTRIGIDLRLVYYAKGGIATYMHHMAELIPKLDSSARYYLIHSRKDRNALSAPPPAPSAKRVSAWTPAHHPLERQALAFELMPLRLRLLHSPDFIPPMPIPGCRNVITVHDLAFLLYPQFMVPDAYRYYNEQIDSAVAQAAHILAVSEATKRDLIRLLGVPEHKITVQLEGVDARFRPLAAEAVMTIRSKLDLPERYLLFVGTFEPRKNIGGLIEAYRILRDRVRNVPDLVLVGRRGWLYEASLSKIEALGLSEYVMLAENVSSDDLPAVYNGADALIMPSFYEGFGLPALEAMACGTPVIASNRASLPEVIGQAGLLIDPESPDEIAEAIRKLLEDDSLRERLREAGIKRAAEFTWERAAKVAVDVYHRVLG